MLSRPYSEASDADLIRELEHRGFTVIPPIPSRTAAAAADEDPCDDHEALAVAFDALLDDEPIRDAPSTAPASTGAVTVEPPPAMSPPATMGSPAETGPPPEMLALARAVMEAQGPRPTYSSFASVPANHPFSDERSRDSAT